jgi:hypothetical protein
MMPVAITSAKYPGNSVATGLGCSSGTVMDGGTEGTRLRRRQPDGHCGRRPGERLGSVSKASTATVTRKTWNATRMMTYSTTADEFRRPRSDVLTPSPPERPDHAVVAHLDIDTAERTRRRTGDDLARLGVEVPFVTRAVPAAFVGLVEDDATEMRALLTERNDVGLGEAQKDRRVVVARIAEQEGSPTATSTAATMAGVRRC